MSNQLKSGLRKSNKKSFVKQLNTNKMETKNNLPYGIKQPTTVQEFRENLKKYFVTSGEHLLTEFESIPLNEISSFDDIYRISKTGMCGILGCLPSITPKIIMKFDITLPFMMSNPFFTFYDYFMNEEYYEIVENDKEFLKRGEPNWFDLKHLMLIGFCLVTLGDYSGYTKKDCFKH